MSVCLYEIIYNNIRNARKLFRPHVAGSGVQWGDSSDREDHLAETMDDKVRGMKNDNNHVLDLTLPFFHTFQHRFIKPRKM